jgi:2-iminobutanoate/2-iminopropanoate deaminase
MKKLLVLCLLLAGALYADNPAPAQQTDKFMLGEWENDIGYRQAVRVGNTLYISGSVGGGEMPAAIREAYGALGQTLRHYGLTFQHVVKENIHTTKLDELKANLAIRRAFYGKDFPAATWVQVNRLYDPGHVLEVELIAVFPEAAPAADAQVEAIRAERLSQNQAIARHDTDLVASFWTDDVTICRGLGVQIAGKPAYCHLFQDDPKDATATIYERIPDEIEASVDWPLAFETGHWTGRKAGVEIISGRYTAQWVRRGDRWLIRSEVFVALHAQGEGRQLKAAP